MKNMKKVLALMLGLTMCIGLMACGKSAPETTAAAETTAAPEPTVVEYDAQDYGLSFTSKDFISGEYAALPADGPEVNLTLAHCLGEATDGHKIMLDLAAALEAYSGGKIKVTIYPNGQMGSDAEIIASCVAGDIDFVYQSGSTHASFVPETTIFDTPFLLTGYDYDKIDQVLTDSEFRTLYNEANEKAGFVCLMLKDNGAMNLTSNREVHCMDDLKGMKIRTAQAESRMAIWKALGANPTPLAFSELYMALQNGTVDAQDNLLVTPIVSKVAEQQKYLIPTSHMVAGYDLVMNKAKMETLPAEYQEMIKKMCHELELMDARIDHEKEEGYYKQLVEEFGLEVCEISDEFDAEMRAAAEPAIQSVKELVGNDALYEALEKALNN